MFRVMLALVLVAGCSGAPKAVPPPAGTCACTAKVCACGHCARDAASARCPCKDLRKPE